MNIALLDDEAHENENLRAMIEAYAAKRNYDIHCEAFTDGRVLLQEKRFDLYFLDFRMEGMDGIEVAQALKEKYSHAVTICYLTNYAAAAAEIINHRIYADGFLKKPVEASLLEEKLDQFYSLSFSTALNCGAGATIRPCTRRIFSTRKRTTSASGCTSLTGSKATTICCARSKRFCRPAACFIAFPGRIWSICSMWIAMTLRASR